MLVERGDKVRVLDNFSSGNPENLAGLAGSIELVRGDLREPADVQKAVSKVELIFHQAAFVSVPQSIENPRECYAINVTGTIELLEAARRSGVRRIVLASSAAVYGNPASLPVGETLVPEPLTPYAIDKFASEQCLSFYRRTFDFDTTIFRLFNVYGPRQDPSSPYSGVISLFVAGAMAGQPIIIFGDGSQTRDFIYVTDVVTAIAGALECPSFAGGPVNVGTGSSQSLHDVIAALKALTERDIYVHYDRARHGDIKHSCADTTRLRATGWKPATSLIVGLSRIIEEAYSL